MNDDDMWKMELNNSNQNTVELSYNVMKENEYFVLL
jgi:hypothetical protein